MRYIIACFCGFICFKTQSTRQIKAQIDNETYFITTDKNNITAIEKQEIQNLAQPKTYDELMQRDKAEATKLDSMYNQYVEIAEIKEAEAQKQLLLEYKPEIKAETSVKELPTKSNLEKDLTQQEIKETIDKWDLTKPNANDKLIISKVEQDELELLKKDFDFKGNYAVVREIDAEHLAHALNRYSDEAVETSRNQIPITKDEALDYQSIIKTHDTREVSGNHIVYKKQINGHYVAVEEVLTGKNKLRFVTMWKSRGNITTAPTPSSKGYDLDRTLSGSYDTAIIPQNPTKAQSEYFNPFMNEYEKIKEIKKLHTQDDNLIRVMKVEGRNDYIEPLSNMGVSKEYLQKQTAQSLKEQITQAILGNQTQLKALQQGYNTYHLSPFQKEVLESVLDIANNPTKLKEYKPQGLQKQLNNLNNNEAYHIEKSREYDKSRYAKDREELEKEIAALKAITMQSNAHLGSGYLGGVMSGKSIERLAKNPKAKAVMERIYLKKDIIPKMQQGKKVDTQEVIKILENSPQKGRDMVVIGKENFTPEVVEYILNAKGGSKKVAVDILPREQAQKLGFKYPQNVRRTIDKAEMLHALIGMGKMGKYPKQESSHHSQKSIYQNGHNMQMKQICKYLVKMIWGKM